MVPASAFFARHRRLEEAADAFPPDDAGQRKSYTIFDVASADGQYRPVLPQDRFGDPRGHNSGTELAGIVSFGNRDVGVAEIPFDALAKAAHEPRQCAGSTNSFDTKNTELHCYVASLFS